MNNQTIKTDLSKADITSRLYSIQNIAHIAAYCEEKEVAVYQLQGVALHIAGMIDSLIDDIGA